MDPRSASGTALLTLARELYDGLLAPAAQTIETADRILIVPDGPLHNLPFGALIRPSTASSDRAWQYVVEWKPLHSTLSATVYAELAKARQRSAARSTVIAFGDPQYPGADARSETLAHPEVRNVLRSGYTLEPLPATRVEVNGLARTFGTAATVYLGAEATESRAKAIRTARYVHFAAHGLLDARSPLDSALALTVPTARREGEDNGLLQAWEIFEQVRLEADEALQRAQREAIAQPATAAPFHWAAFTLSGDWR